MLTDKDIEDFYDHLNSLGLRFPVADISKATGRSKGRISEYLNRAAKPSAGFLKRFYEKFPKSSQPEPILAQLMAQMNNLMQTQNNILKDQKVDLVDRVKGIESNLNTALGGVAKLSLHVESARVVALKSLARLEKKPEQSLVKEADNMVKRKISDDERPGTGI